MANETMQPRRRRGVYLLPNFFTTTALFAGFYAIISAMEGRFNVAAIAVLVAMVMDGIDGRVARLTNTQTEFGAEYDSLSDVVSFGLAPALIVYEWALADLAAGDSYSGNLGWLAAFLYAACAALRLARFNAEIGKADKRFFQGLASPAAAAIMVSMVWVGYELGYPGDELSILAFAVTVATALLMVSKFSYYSFKDLGSSNRVPFVTLLALVLFFFFTSIDPPKVIFALAVIYGLSGPTLSLLRWLRKRGQRVRRGAV